jgi:hypothetical protein
VIVCALKAIHHEQKKRIGIGPNGYVLFFDKRYPKEMGSTGIEEFISCLAFKKNLLGSTQNQQIPDW